MNDSAPNKFGRIGNKPSTKILKDRCFYHGGQLAEKIAEMAMRYWQGTDTEAKRDPSEYCIKAKGLTV